MARENNKARKQFSLEYSRLGIVPHFLQGKYASAREFSFFPPRVTSSRVAIFTLVLVFRSLFYPYRKGGTTRSLRIHPRHARHLPREGTIFKHARVFFCWYPWDNKGILTTCTPLGNCPPTPPLRQHFALGEK